ncbi:hypothetical protein NECAME_15239 [Necator americanus]|uniref:Uncharacterized protein n=1 Tax=Necator americanus TaxID=51031 RepID=W2SKZ7_NECAM|nr:hypothetical protein NECAME_15239 [Necator americanus]ETN69551.1 hypothetical protein NECAME_15239 [Necator americanus]
MFRSQKFFLCLWTKMYSPYMGAQNGLYSARSSSAANDRARLNDLLLAENESLRARVVELEKTVSRQQSELGFVESIVDLLLRRKISQSINEFDVFPWTDAVANHISGFASTVGEARNHHHAKQWDC